MSRRGRRGEENIKCQNCLQKGHWTYECKNEKVYLKRETKSSILRRNGKPEIKPVKPPEILEHERRLQAFKARENRTDRPKSSHSSSHTTPSRSTHTSRTRSPRRRPSRSRSPQRPPSNSTSSQPETRNTSRFPVSQPSHEESNVHPDRLQLLGLDQDKEPISRKDEHIPRKQSTALTETPSEPVSSIHPSRLQQLGIDSSKPPITTRKETRPEPRKESAAPLSRPRLLSVISHHTLHITSMPPSSLKKPPTRFIQTPLPYYKRR